MKTLIRNIGTLVSGDIRRPILDADSIQIEGGRITAVGKGVEDSAETVIDAKGSTVIPGLIDSHCHPVFGDFTPRQRTVGYLESYLHGGVTTAISASEVHVPGRPRDVQGVKALAVAAQRCFASYRPGGMRVIAGSVILEPGLKKEDFVELAGAGVTLSDWTLSATGSDGTAQSVAFTGTPLRASLSVASIRADAPISARGRAAGAEVSCPEFRAASAAFAMGEPVERISRSGR